MEFTVLIFTAIALGMDAFAVAIASSISLGTITPRQIFRFSFHFGLFQALMPLIGWLAGLTLAEEIRAWDHWVAFALLTFIGIRAIHGGLKKADNEEYRSDPTRGLSLVALSIATSIDALAVGISFAMLEVDIWYPVAIIGVVAAVMTLSGMLLARRLGQLFGKRVEIVGGLILMGIGAKILIEHLSA